MNATHNIALRYFLTSSEDEVMGEFAKLPHAVRGEGFVYIPGEREWAKRLLLVGHADTVRGGELPMKQLGCFNNVFCTLDNKPLGADDRAGLAQLWLLNADSREHSMLITTGEEVGGKGASEAVDSICGELLQHAFCIEVDRAGSEEMVFYDGCANAAFKAWLGEMFPKWDQDVGSFTDIATVCPATLLCGVNLAAGYHGQHGANERLVYAEWLKTMKALEPVLAMPEYPEFGVPDEKEPRKYEVVGYSNWRGGDTYVHRGHEGWQYDHHPWWDAEDELPVKPTGKLADLVVTTDEIDWLPVLNEAGDIVDYIDPKKLHGDVLEHALQDGCVEACDLEPEEDEGMVQA
jgi:hypothetical protein